MAVIENEGLMKYIDEAGNKFIMYPITRAGLVEGLDELLNDKADTTKKATVTLSTSWAGSASPYTQSVTISGTTANSKVDLQPDAAVIAQMANDGTTALYIVNNTGSLTAYAVGMKPTASMTIQATVSEVSA